MSTPLIRINTCFKLDKKSFYAYNIYKQKLKGCERPMPLTPKEMAKKFEKVGYVLKRTRGSHYVYENTTTKQIAIIPMHPKDLKKGLEKRLLKQLGE